VALTCGAVCSRVFNLHISLKVSAAADHTDKCPRLGEFNSICNRFCELERCIKHFLRKILTVHQKTGFFIAFKLSFLLFGPPWDFDWVFKNLQLEVRLNKNQLPVITDASKMY